MKQWEMIRKSMKSKVKSKNFQVSIKFRIINLNLMQKLNKLSKILKRKSSLENKKKTKIIQMI